MEHWPLLFATALAAATLAGVAGTGGGIILLPVLVSVFGVREAVPMYAVASLVGNLSRVYLNRAVLDFRVCGWFVAGAVPLALLGAWLFTRIPDPGLVRLLGAFLLLSVLARRAHPAFRSGFRTSWFLPIGGAFAVVSAVVGSAGPFLAPFFIAYGLTRGVFIGTEALGTAVMHVAKLSSYQGLGAMSSATWLGGLALAPAMVLGSLAARRVVDRIPPRIFLRIIEIVIAGFGLWFLLRP